MFLNRRITKEEMVLLFWQYCKQLLKCISCLGHSTWKILAPNNQSLGKQLIKGSDHGEYESVQQQSLSLLLNSLVSSTHSVLLKPSWFRLFPLPLQILHWLLLASILASPPNYGVLFLSFFLFSLILPLLSSLSLMMSFLGHRAYLTAIINFSVQLCT